jgi:outer membrane lipoprotein-sorting protein
LPLSFVALRATDTLPSADEIVQKYIDARGGIEKIHAIQTVRMVGTADFNGQMQGELTVQTKRPNLFRFDMNLPQGSMIQAFDGTTSWSINPFTGGTEPRKDSESDTAAARDLHDIDGNLVDYKTKGNKVEVLGMEDVNGSPAYKLRVTAKGGTVSTVWIDKATYHDVKMAQTRPINGQDTEVIVMLSNFKPVNGVLTPFTFDQQFGQMNMKINFSSAEANVPMDDTMFHMPAAAPASAAPGGATK